MAYRNGRNYNNYNNNNYNNENSTSLVPINNAAINILKETEKIIPRLLFPQLFLMKKPKDENEPPSLYLKAAGAKYKIDELYRDRFSVEIDIPKNYKSLKEAMGMENAEFCVIIEATLYVDGKKISKEYGTATPFNVKKGSKNFLLELAVTRAKRRVYLDICGGGYAQAGELYDEDGEFDIAEKLWTEAKKKMFSLFRQKGIDPKNRDKRLEYCSEVLGYPIKSTKDLLYVDIEKVNRALSGIVDNTCRVINDDESIIPTNDDLPPPKVNLVKLEQITEIRELYKKLNWSEQQVSDMLAYLSGKAGREYKTEEDMDSPTAQTYINYLSDRLRRLKEKSEDKKISDSEISDLYRLAGEAGYNSNSEANVYFSSVLKFYVDEIKIKTISHNEIKLLRSELNKKIQQIVKAEAERETEFDYDEAEFEQHEKEIAAGQYIFFEEGAEV